MKAKVCSVEGCAAKVKARGWCSRHYDRWHTHGSPVAPVREKAGRGEVARWFSDHAEHTGDACLIWPFGRKPDGRPHHGSIRPARFMCELAHGAAPTPAHHAAHSCGKANAGCMNPRHLRWATPKENNADKVAHGTNVEGEQHYAAKLTEADVRNIRSAKGATLEQLAETYGVGLTTVQKVRAGTSWKHVR